MEDTPGAQHTKSESNKSTGRQDGGPYSCTTRHISSVNNSTVQTLIKYEIDESLTIKEEFVPDQESHQLGKHNLLSVKNELEEEYITTEISAVNNSGAKTLIEHDYDEALEIEEEIDEDQQTMIETNKSTGSQDGGPYSGTYTHIPSGNNSGGKTSAEYSIDESLDIKKEIVQDAEGHQQKKNNVLSGRIQLHEKCITTEISCDNNSACNTLIKDEYGEALEIKEEIIQDQGNIEQGLSKKCDSKLCTSDTRETNIMTAVDPRTCVKQEIHESKSEPRKKYKCEKCGRNYSQKRILSTHKKFMCDVIPQFSCEFCGKKFKVKYNMNAHILRVHQKKKSKAPQTRQNCDECSLSYSSLDSLNKHRRLKHGAVQITYICDICDEKFKRKDYLSQHITSYHFLKIHGTIPEPKKKYKCEKCARCYVQKDGLYKHKKFHCGVMPQFSCEFCGRLFKLKGNMNGHILRVHQKTNSKTSQTRQNCDECSRSYSSKGSLNDHKRLEHAAVKIMFICDICDKKFKSKGYLSSHIASRHSQEIHGVLEKKYKCEKCARSYAYKKTLFYHIKFECDVIPQFSCEFCGKQFKQKGSMNRHVDYVHLKKESQIHRMAPFSCELCGKQFKQKSHMKRHMDHVHQKTCMKQKIEESKLEQKEKYKCEKCGRNYSQKRVLNIHQKFKCDVLPQFSCEFCGKQFKLKGNMNAHILRMHQKKNSTASQTRQNCDECSRSYSSKVSLNDHKRLEHAAVKIIFICDICDQKFKRKDYLSQHITSRHFQEIHGLISEPEKKYKCEKCARSYLRKRTLWYHMKFECDVIPQFDCEFCGKRFQHKCSVNRHVAYVHLKKESLNTSHGIIQL